MKPEQSPFAPGWWGTSLDNVGLDAQRPLVGTYGRYQFANMPDLPVPLDGDLGWLAAAPAHDAHIGAQRAEENARSIPMLIDACKAAAVSLPSTFLKFARAPHLQERVRSNTDCFLDLPEAPVPSPVGDGVLVRFLSDSQACVFWYLYLPTGVADHAVVSSPDYYGPDAERFYDGVGDWSITARDPDRLTFSAESFEAFLCRFWIENELWFSEYEGTPMSEEGRRYLESYRQSGPDPLVP
jgi:hypothetical protein